MWKILPHRKSFSGQDLSVMERWEKKDQDLYMEAGDNNMKINIGNHEFTELWDGVLYKALSAYPKVSDNEMKDIID